MYYISKGMIDIQNQGNIRITKTCLEPVTGGRSKIFGIGCERAIPWLCILWLSKVKCLVLWMYKHVLSYLP